MKVRIKLFHFFIFLITLCKALGLDSENKIYVVAFALGCFAVLIKMMREKYTHLEFLSMTFIVVVGVADLLLGHTATILFTAIAICGMKNTDTKQIIKLVFWTRVVGFVVLILCSALGIVNDATVMHYRDGTFIERYKLGYGHPNTAHMAFTIIVVLSMYLYGEKMKCLHYVILVVCNRITFFFTASRTGFMICNISVIFWILLQFEKIRKPILKYGRHFYLGLFAITVCAGLLYGHVGFLDRLDGMLTGRIAYISQILKSGSPPIIGSKEYSESVMVDNGYITLMYNGGLLAFGWISYYMLCLSKKLYREGRYRDFFLVTNFVLYSLTESFFPSIAVNISLLLLGEVVFGTKGRKIDVRNNSLHPNLQPGKGTKGSV